MKGNYRDIRVDGVSASWDEEATRADAQDVRIVGVELPRNEEHQSP